MTSLIPAHGAVANEDAGDELLRLRQHAEIFRALLDHFPNGIVLTDKDLNVIICNKRQMELLEYPREMFAHGMPTLPQLFAFNAMRGEYGPGDPGKLLAEKMALVEKRIPHVFERMRPDGRVLEVRGIPLPEGGFVTTYADVTERRREQEMLLRQASRDTLTGLESRSGLHKKFDALLKQCLRTGEGFALHCIDLDHFKPVNDRYGHNAGDQLLMLVARRLLNTVRETDLVARWGGDEFIVLQSQAQGWGEAAAMAERLEETLNKEYQVPQAVGSLHLRIRVSIGTVLAEELSEASKIEDFIEAADRAMYAKKRQHHAEIEAAAL